MGSSRNNELAISFWKCLDHVPGTQHQSQEPEPAFRGNLLYTHAAMNVMGFRYALKFTTIVGDVPQQFEVSHLCGHSHCYRPSHLVLDSHRVNLLRSRCRGCGKDKEGADYNHCVHADLPGSSGRHCFGHEQCPEYCPERLKQRTSAAKEQGNG